MLLRLNADLIALGKNYSDEDLNKRFSRSLGILDEYKLALKESEKKPYSFILINKGFKIYSMIEHISQNLYNFSFKSL